MAMFEDSGLSQTACKPDPEKMLSLVNKKRAQLEQAEDHFREFLEVVGYTYDSITQGAINAIAGRLFLERVNFDKETQHWLAEIDKEG